MQTFGLKDQAYATRFMSGTDSVLPKKRVQVQLRKQNVAEAINAFRSAWNGIDLYPAYKERIDAERAEQVALRRAHDERAMCQAHDLLRVFVKAAIGGDVTVEPPWSSISTCLVSSVPRELSAAKREGFLVWFLEVEFSLSVAECKSVLATLRTQRKQHEQARRSEKEAGKQARAQRQQVLEAERARRAEEKLLVPAYAAPELLGITKTEYERWRAAGLIPIAGERSFYKWGRSLTTVVHPANLAELVTPANIEAWRASHQESLRKNRALAAAQAKKTRAANDTIRKAADEAWEEMFSTWSSSYGQEHAATLALAFWTQFASRWAKHHECSGNESGHYHVARDQWYDVKDQALRVLSKSPLSRVSFVPSPDAPWTELRVQFCDAHLDEFREGRGVMWNTASDYIDFRGRALKRCALCECSYIDHAMDGALYFVEVLSPCGQVRFGFHTPYRKGRSYLPSPKTLSHAAHATEEYMGDPQFRFGRPVLESEAIPFSEARTRKAIAGLLAAVVGTY